MKGDSGVGGGECQGVKTRGDGMGATAAAVSEGLACGVRVAVAVEGGGLEKEGMVAYDNEVNPKPKTLNPKPYRRERLPTPMR